MGIFVHHLDHLAPLCELMGVSLVVPDESDAVLARMCYPWLQVTVDTPWLTPGALAGRVLYCSHLFTREFLRSVCGGPMPARVVFCPHGFSEKRQRWSAAAAFQDVFLVHGQFGLDQLKDWGVFDQAERYVLISSLRYRHYLRHREFFDSLAARLAPQSPGGRRTILYAPTWNDALGSTSVFHMIRILVDHLPDGYDLLIKTHPLLEQHPERLDAVLSATKAHSRVKVIRNNPLIYPWLARADVYIGDMSAVAYDFLVFDRPMYFLNQTYGGSADAAATRLFQCGTVVAPDAYERIFHRLESEDQSNSQYSERRKALWSYVHDESRLAEEVKRDILVATRGAAPSWMYPVTADSTSEPSNLARAHHK